MFGAAGRCPNKISDAWRQRSSRQSRCCWVVKVSAAEVESVLHEKSCLFTRKTTALGVQMGPSYKRVKIMGVFELHNVKRKHLQQKLWM